MVSRFLKRQKWISIFVSMLFFMQTVGGVAFAAPQVNNAGNKQYKSVGLASAKLKSEQRSYLPGEVLVKYKSNTSTMAQSKAISSAGIEKNIEKLGPKGKPDINHYKLNAGQTVDQAITELKKDPNVLFAEPNYISKIALTPNDTFYGDQWGLNNTGQALNTSPITPGGTVDADIDAPEAWNLETGATNPVTVAVIDSGIDMTHPDLAGKIWTNTAESTGIPGVDDNVPANGYIDDVNGYNFAGISQYGSDHYAAINGLANPYNQSIKGTGQKLTDIAIMLSKIGSPTENVTVSVRSTVGGADLASATISSSEIATTPMSINKTLSSPITLTNNVTYYIIVSTTNATSAYNIYFTIGNPYADGNMQRFDTGAWVNMPDYDLYFKTNANPNPRDDNGHGTHVSGIIAASANNANGISGVSHGAKIMPLKAGDSSGSLLSTDIIAAINYAADNGAKVINMSIGSSSYSAAEQTAVDYAYGKGVVIFAAAGNDGNTTVNYPAADNHVIGVGATNMSDARAAFSNYNSSVDISAPGDLILSTTPTYSNYFIKAYVPGDEYIFMSGTSMATPMAAGVAALMLSADPTLTPAQVESIMTQNADDLGVVGRDDQFGYGRVNANKALTYIKDVTAPTGTVTINSGALTTGTQNVSLTMAATDAAPSTGLTEMWISNDNIAGTWEAYATSKSWNLTSGEGSKTVYVKFRDRKGNTSTATTSTITLDTPPTGGAVVINSNAAKTNSTLVNLNIVATGATEMWISNDGLIGTWEPYATTKAWTMATGDGTKTVYIKFRDPALNVSTASTDTIVLDTTAPTGGSVVINNGAVGTNSATVSLALSATGASEMWISNDGTTGTWEPYVTTKSWPLPTGDGLKTVSVKFRDDVLNTTSILTSTITLDTTPPTGGSISINSGAITTNQLAVNLGITAIGATEMMISNSATFAGGIWEPYSITKAWVLTPVDGTKTVYIQFRDSVGNVSTTSTGTIVLDAPPTGTIAFNNGAGYTNATSATLNITYSADATQMWISDDAGFATGTWETVAATKPWTLSATEGTKTVYIKFKDAGGQQTAYSNTIVFDATAPVGGSVNINGGAASTASATVTLAISATDTPAGMGQMMISNDSSFTGASWETYSALKSWTLTTGNGSKTVYIKFKDNAGNATGSYSDTIVLDVPPAPTSAPAPVYPGKLLQNGASGQSVNIIQQKLNSLGFNSGAIDGRFGPKTKAAIIAFQKANGLVPDGIIGPLTWAKLFGSAGGTSYTGPITYGIVNSNVTAIQAKLAALGFNPGPVDGIFGPKSLAAIKAFQKSRGLAADGIVGPLTWHALFG